MEVDKLETQKVLNHFKSLSFDLSKEMEIDFFIEGNQNDLQNVEIDICKLFNNTCCTNIEYNQEFDIWTCYCSMRIIPDLQKVISIENDLFQIAIKNNCSYEGFGSFGN